VSPRLSGRQQNERCSSPRTGPGAAEAERVLSAAHPTPAPPCRKPAGPTRRRQHLGTAYLPPRRVVVACRRHTAVLAITSWRRTRTAADTYTTLPEAAARLHARDPAHELGLAPTGPLTHGSSDTVTHRLAPSPPPVPGA
jgi:hypothetical protein